MNRFLFVLLIVIMFGVIALVVYLGSREEQTSSYYNPVDGKTYVADWKLHKPDKYKEITHRVNNIGVTLLTSNDELEQRTTSDALVVFCKESEAIAQSVLEGTKTEANIRVQFDCIPELCEVSMVYQGVVSKEQLEEFHGRLSKMKPLAVSSGSVSLQINFQIMPELAKTKSSHP